MSDGSVLFHIGLHKSASSALQNYFFVPEHGFAQNGGRDWILNTYVNKFSTEGLSQTEKSQLNSFVTNAYAQNLLPVASHERLSGYPLTGGMDRDSILRRIRRSGQKVKILLVIREQKKWLYSAWKQMIWDGASIDLEDFLEPPYAPANMRFPRPNLHFIDYGAFVAELHHLFGKKNVCVVPVELIAIDFPKFQNDLYQFLDHQQLQKLKKLEIKNHSKNLSSIYMMKLLNKYFLRSNILDCGLVNTHSVSGKKLRNASTRIALLAPKIKAFDSLESKHQKIIRQFVGDRYDKSNKQASKLINIDLSQFGY